MKKILSVLALFSSGMLMAQPKLVKSAIIKMKTEITFPENFTP
ncbi:MAG: hypothetical protein RL282_1056, partial [Bacteroidota bacterium]